MNNKAALPINLLVIVIISLVILSGGIYFVYDFSDATEDIQEQTRLEPVNVAHNQQTQMLRSKAHIKRGQSNEFPLVVLNIGEEQDFKIDVELDRLIPPNGIPVRVGVDDWLLYETQLHLVENEQKEQHILVQVPTDADEGDYEFKAIVKNAQNRQIGTIQRFTVTVAGDKPTARPKAPAKIQKPLSCIEDFSCARYFVYVPTGKWPGDAKFIEEASERQEFFLGISKFNPTTTGTLYVPIEFTAKCNVVRINQRNADEHMKIKKCADRYADSVGIDYERAIGLDFSFGESWTFFNKRSAYATLGFQGDDWQQERVSLVAHELGHTYNVCDEHDFATWSKQNNYFGHNTCKNTFPPQCSKTELGCPGNQPVVKKYNKKAANVCIGTSAFSVMGYSSGQECGYDQDAYQAIG